MTVLSDQTIRDRIELGLESADYRNCAFGLGIEPFFPSKQVHSGMSYGLSVAGYDIRIGQIDRWKTSSAINDYQQEQVTSTLVRSSDFVLLSSMERFKIPVDLIAFVHDKSTLARKGLALQNTVLEPGWEGYITLELSHHGIGTVQIEVGMPIAQVVFHQLDRPAQFPYNGKYQNQGAEPTHAIEEKP